MFSIVDSYVYEVRVVGEVEQQACINSLYLHAVDESVGVTPFTSADLLALFQTRWRDTVITEVCNTYQVRRFEVRNILGANRIVGSSGTTYPFIYDENYDLIIGDEVNDVGDVNQDALPTFVAGTLRKVTGKLGRGRSGSLRIGAVPESATANAANSFSPGSLGTWQTMATALNAQYEHGTPPAHWNLNHVHLSAKRVYDLVTGPAGVWVVSDPIQNLEVNLNLGSQTSRKLKSYGR